MNVFIEDDADEMIRIIQKQFQIIAGDYLLSSREAEKSADVLREKLDGKKLKDMYASGNREKYAQNILLPIVENQIKKKERISLLDE